MLFLCWEVCAVMLWRCLLEGRVDGRALAEWERSMIIKWALILHLVKQICWSCVISVLVQISQSFGHVCSDFASIFSERMDAAVHFWGCCWCLRTEIGTLTADLKQMTIFSAEPLMLTGVWVSLFFLKHNEPFGFADIQSQVAVVATGGQVKNLHPVGRLIIAEYEPERYRVVHEPDDIVAQSWVNRQQPWGVPEPVVSVVMPCYQFLLSRLC